MTDATTTRLLRLLEAEQFTEFDQELDMALRAVDTQAADQLQQTVDGLMQLLVGARMKRAGYAAELDELRAARVFFGARESSPSVNVMG